MLNIIILSVLTIMRAGIYEQTIQGANGETIHLESFKGKNILFVNIASQSKYIDQIGRLERLYQKHKDSLVIIATPSNDFGHEPP